MPVATRFYARGSLLLSTAWLVQAQRMQVDTTPKFEANDLTKASLAIWSISGLAYLIFTVLLFLTLVQRRYRESRRTFAPLFLAMIFSFIRVCITIATLVMDNMTFYVPSRRILNSLAGVFVYCQVWTPPLVFMTVMFILNERYTAVFGERNGQGEKKLPAEPIGPNELPCRKWFLGVHIFLLVGMLGPGTVAAVVINRIRGDILNRSIRTVAELVERMAVYDGLYYAFRAVWACTIFDIVLLAKMVRRRVQRVHPSDSVTWTMLFVVCPLYTCYVLQNIAFIIAFSPVGINPNDWRLGDKVGFASVFISNFFFVAMVAYLVKIARSGELSDPPPDMINHGNGSQMQILSYQQDP